MKTCATCTKTLPMDAFGRNRRNRDGRMYNCKCCTSEYSKRHYQSNKNKYVAKAGAWSARQTVIMREAKTQPCADCGGTFHPCAMDFDHRPGEQKLFNISRAVKSIGLERLRAEIEKCDVVCANCHRIHTFNRR